jgi:uncharacterized protein (TIGR00251 family)
MKISVRVKANARTEEVTLESGIYLVKTKAAPHDGKANEAVIRILAEHFRKPKSAVRIVTGATGKNKIVEILD